MNKRVITAVLFSLATVLLQAQQIKVAYKNESESLPQLMQYYFEMQKVQHIRATIKGDFNGKRAKIKKVSCSKGTFEEKDLLPDFVHFILADSTETLDFMAVPYGKDSLHIACFYPENYNRVLFNDTVRIDEMKILMETYTPDSSAHTPILAYTQGIPISGGTWFCGLRDSGIAPRKWFEKYRIDNYLFYTISLEEDTPANKEQPIYVKIAKKDAFATHK